MENSTKKRVSVEIAGNSLTLVTDEPEEFVTLLAEQLNQRLSSITKNSFRVSTLDAALLCAIDALGDKLKAEKRVRTLEAQAAVYEVNLQSLRDELEEARKPAEPAPAAVEPMRETETIARAIKEEDGEADDKIRVLENYLENKKAPGRTADSARTREEKIRYIESLLRGSQETAETTKDDENA